MTKIHALVVALLLSFPAPVFAQHTMPITVQADRVLIGGEYVRRCTDLPNVLTVPVGATSTLPADSTWDCIEVAGKLLTPPSAMTVRFTHFIILPGGEFEDRAACGVSHELIVRNVLIDPARDPFQWGNGLLNFGKQTRIGCAKTSFLEATGSIAKGSTTVQLASAPVGWLAGDELLIPDTDKPVITGDGRQLTAVPSRREPPVFIKSLVGTTLELSKPLDFEHLNIADPQGRVVLRPRIANLTRNIVIRSENSATPQVGVRGHTADIGEEATWDIQFNEFVQLGRTGNTPLDDFVATTGHQGTNQRGKYAEHHHHNGTAVGAVDKGNVYRGHPLRTKWALALHGTHDALVQDNVGVDFPGAIFVTEDGYEVRNVFDHNFAAYSFGIPGDTLVPPDDAHIKINCPGCGGAGFWFRGVKNSYTRNESWNNFRGIDFFNQSGMPGSFPSAPGLMPDTPFVATDNQKMQPIAFKANVAAANVNAGLELWAVKDFQNIDFISAYNATQSQGVLTDGIDHHYVNPTLVCKQGSGSIGITAGQGYSTDFKIEHGGYIGGCYVGIHEGGGKTGIFLTGPETLTLQNETNIDQIPPAGILHTNVMHVPLGTHPPQYLVFDNVGRFSGKVWAADEPLPDAGVSMWRYQNGSAYKVINWQGTGQDYLLLRTQSLGSNPAWYSAGTVHQWNVPVKGLTMEQAWNQYGLSFDRDMLKDAEKVVLPGVINAFGRKGLGVALSQARAIMTFPTMRVPAFAFGEPNDLYVRLALMATGDLTPASPDYVVQVDNGPPKHLLGEFTFDGSDRSFNMSGLTAGVHTVKVWLTQKANPALVLAGSEGTGTFCVGVDCQTSVPVVKLLTQAYTASALANAYLLPGPVTKEAHATIPEGYLIRTIPPADTTVPQKTPIGLVVSTGSTGQPIPTTVTVPSVVGQMGPAAEAAIIAAKLVVGNVANATNPAPLGQVMKQSPSAGTVVNVNSAVDIVVSSGPPPDPVCIPPAVLTNGVCVTPTQIDLCPNIAGVQTTVPAGMVLVNGQCVIVSPSPNETWRILMGIASGTSLRQLMIGTVPQPRFRIYVTPTQFFEFQMK